MVKPNNYATIKTRVINSTQHTPYAKLSHDKVLNVLLYIFFIFFPIEK